MWERILGISKSAKAFFRGKVTIENIKELSASQIATSRLLRWHFEKQIAVCAAMQANINACLVKIAEYDKEISAGAIFEQVDLIRDDFQRLLDCVAANLAVLNIFKGSLANLRKAIQTRRDISQYIKELMSALSDYQASFNNLHSENMAISRSFGASLDASYLNTLSSESRTLESSMVKLAQDIQDLSKSVRIEMDERRKISRIDAMYADIENIVAKLSKFGTMGMAPKLNPRRLSFKLTPEVQRIFDLILQNQMFAAEFLSHQTFYVEKGTVVGINPRSLQGPLKQAAGRMTQQLDVTARAVS